MLLKLLLRVLLVALIIGAIAYPWNAPDFAARLTGFDANFIYVDPYGRGNQPGIVIVSEEHLTITAIGNSRPTVILAASQAAFTLDFDLIVSQDSDQPAFPFEIVVFFPGTDNRVSLWYYSVERWIRADVERANYTDRLQPKHIGHYLLRSETHIQVVVVPGGFVEFTLSNSTWRDAYRADADVLGPLLSADRRVVQVLAAGDSQASLVSSSVMLSNMVVSVPNVSLGQKISDGRSWPVFLGLSGLSVVLLRSEFSEFGRRSLKRFRKYIFAFPRSLWALVLGSVIISMALSGLANHPYDIFVEKIYSYTLVKEGLGALYARPLVTAAATPWQGAPFGDAIFVYPPFSGYYFLTAGLILYPLGIMDTSSFLLEFAIKLIGALATAIGGLLTYDLVRKIGGSARSSLLGAGLFLLNPALIYDTAVWGQTDSIIATMLVAGALFLVTKKSALFWTTVIGAVLVKQTALFPAGVLMIIGLRSFSWKTLIQGITAAMGTLFLLLMPFLAVGYSPLIAVSQTVAVFILQLSPTSGVLSRDAYNFLPLLSSLNGLVGRDRMALPAAAMVPSMSISYSTLGTALFAIFALPLLFKEVVRNSKEGSRRTVLAVGVLTLLSVFFLPGVSSRYFVLALALLIPPSVVSGGRLLTLSIGLLTTTATISMHGLLTLWASWHPGIFIGLRSDNTFSSWIISLYTSDIAMTGFILTNLLAVTIVVAYTLRPAGERGSQNWKERRTCHQGETPQSSFSRYCSTTWPRRLQS